MASDIVEEFRDEWSRWHSNRQPLGWMLRQDSTLPWVRFHALPESKRYASNDEDYGIILARANSLGDRFLGAGTPCWIVDPRADDVAGTGELAAEWSDSDDLDGPIWRFYVEQADWRSGTFDSRLLAIADDRVRSIWIRRDSGAIFAPYDGGFDLFPSNDHEVADLKAEWSFWLSSRPDEL